MPIHVLIVDDNPTNLKLASDVLASTGITVDQAVDAEAAQALLQHVMPDLILMDLGLPGMGGLMLTKVLKANSRLQHIPIVALTAFAMKGDELRAFEAGCCGYIKKPIDTRTFAQRIVTFARPERGQ